MISKQTAKPAKPIPTTIAAATKYLKHTIVDKTIDMISTK